MNHNEWTDAQSETNLTVDGHDLFVAFYDSDVGGRQSAAGPDLDTNAERETLVFLHGIPTWSYLWRDVAPAFEDEYRVLVPDMLGYGNSDRRDGFDRSIRTQESMLEALLDDLGEERVSIVAHDIGGGVALRFAANWPERVDRLVASNAVCYDSWPVEFIAGLGVPATADLDDEEFEGKLDFAFAEGTYGEADEEFVAGMKAPWLREGGKRAVSRAAVATNTNHTTEIDYDAIDADVLCLWGGDDVLQPLEYGERLAEDLGGEVVELEEAYHWVVEDRPDAFREELRAFLTVTDGPGGGR